MDATPAPPASPDPYQDKDAINDLITKNLEHWQRGRENMLRAAKRNLLFYRGHQWIRYDRGLNRFRPLTVRRNTPQPVTNRFASTTDAVISVFARIEPRLNFRPATDEPEDRAAADVATRSITVIEDETNIRVTRQFLAAWVGLTGGAWTEIGYDPDPIHGLRLVPHEECLTCGATQPYRADQTCAGCGSRLLIPAIGPDGQPVGDQMPIGRLYTDVVSIFEMFFDPAEPNWKKQRKYCRKKTVTLEEAKARWSAFADRIQTDTVESETELSGADLATLGPSLDDGTPMRGLARSSTYQSPNNRVTEEWFWSLPTSVYPDGLLAIRLNKTIIVHAGPLPYRRKDSQGGRTPFLPHVFFPQKLVPGTAFPKTVADDLATKQVQRNQLEALMMLILMRTGSPSWLKPTGSDVKNLTGEPGQIIEYNALGPSPAKPERIPGQGLPAGLFHLIQQIDQDFEEIASTYEILKGNRPEGVSAGIALQILQERAMSKFGPLFILWENAWAEWATQALEIYREYATEERLVRLQGRNGTWEVTKFLGADLEGRVDIIAEAGSALPRSSLADKAEIEQLHNLGLLDFRDPEVAQKALELFGRANLTPGMALEAKNGIQENEVFEALGAKVKMFTPAQNQAVASVLQTAPEQLAQALIGVGVAVPQVRADVDDHGIHIREHLLFLRSEVGKQQPMIVQQLAEQHVKQHRQSLVQLSRPHPPVRIALKGELDPQTAQDLAGDVWAPPNGLAGPGASGGTGLLASPSPQIHVSPLNAGSSAKRMLGDYLEMGQHVGDMAGHV